MNQKVAYRKPYVVDIAKDYLHGGRVGGEMAIWWCAGKQLFPDPSKLQIVDRTSLSGRFSPDPEITAIGSPWWFPFDRYLVVGVFGLDRYVYQPALGALGSGQPTAPERTDPYMWQDYKEHWEYQRPDLPELVSEIPYVSAKFTSLPPERSKEAHPAPGVARWGPEEWWNGPGFAIVIGRSAFVIASALGLLAAGLGYVIRVWLSPPRTDWNILEFTVSLLALRGAFMFVGAPVSFTLFDALVLALFAAYGSAFFRRKVRRLRSTGE